MSSAKTETNNSENLGTVYFQKGYDLFSTDEDASYSYLQKSLSFLSIDRDSETYATAYNVLGIISTHREDYTTAIKQLNSCLSICYCHNHPYVAGLASANLGFLFQNIRSYEKAIIYYEQASEFFRIDNTHDNYEAYRATLLTNIYNCYYCLGNREKMYEYLAEMRNVQDLIEPSFSMPLYEAIYSKSTNDYEGMNCFVDETLSKFLKDQELTDYIDICHVFCEFLYANELFPQLNTALEYIDSQISDSIFPRIRIEFVKYKMACYKNSGDMEKYLIAANEHIALYEKITEIFHKSISESVQLGIELKELEKEYEKFVKKADTDALTQLINRYGMDEHVPALIENARENRTKVSAFIIDIDYFKQYNDHYGHVLGDECIKKVAQVLKSSFDEASLVCRFGGDEFTAFSYGMSDSDARNMADAIVQGVRNLRIVSVDSPASENVSVSVGYYTGVPSEEETFETLIDHADKGLYLAKESGRNCACAYEG